MATGFQFGTVGSPISTPKKPGGSVGAILQTAALGLSAMELGWVQSVRVSEETCHMIKQTAVDNRISLSVHAPYFINLNANESEWPNSRKRLMDAAYYGNLAGATDIIFHPGSYFEKPSAEVLPIAQKRLKECSDELRVKGISAILRPETMGKSALIGSIEDTLMLSSTINGVLPCIDFAHLHARAGNGTMNTYKEWNELLQEYAAALGHDSLKHLHIHLSGIEYSAKGERNHLPMKDSDFDISGLFKALNNNHCEGRILCESPIMEEDALYFMQLWNEIK